MQDKDNKLSFSIILIITLIFIGIAGIFYVKFQAKQRIVKRERIEQQMRINQERLKDEKQDYSDFLEKYKCPEGKKCGGS